MLAFLIAFSCVLTACTPRRGTASSDSSSNPLKGADASGDTRLNVVTTLFPYYDFLRQIAGDSIRLTMVVPAGMDSHSFEPTPADMITIQNADLLVCNGGTMEQWLSQVLDSFGEGTGPKRVVTMMDCVDVVQEEIVEGMEDGEAHDHGEAALVDQVNDQLHLVAGLKVGHLGLVAGLHQRIEAGVDQLGNTAAQHGLLAEQIGLGLLLEGGLQNACTACADAGSISQCDILGLTGVVLLHAHGGRQGRVRLPCSPMIFVVH